MAGVFTSEVMGNEAYQGSCEYPEREWVTLIKVVELTVQRFQKSVTETLVVFFALGCGVGAYAVLFPHVDHSSHAATDMWEVLLYAFAGLCAGLVYGFLSKRRFCWWFVLIIGLVCLTIDSIRFYFLWTSDDWMPVRNILGMLFINIISGDTSHILVLGPAICTAIGTALGARLRCGPPPPRPPDYKVMI